MQEGVFKVCEGTDEIYCGQKDNNKRYADGTVLLTEKQPKKAATSRKGSKGKQKVIINCKTKCMIISKTYTSRCEIQIRYVKIKQVQELSYLECVITNDNQCDREIGRRIGIAKDGFQKVSIILGNSRMETNIRVCLYF